jgi:hypothetical protein
VLRYANLIDQNIGTEAIVDLLAEGQAFWRILAPWMANYHTDAVKVFDRMFSTTYHPQAANNYNYCIAKKYIDAFLTSVMGTASAAATALGSLDEVPSGVTCPTDSTHGLITSIATDAGTYTLQSTDNDVGGSLQFSEAVKKVVDLCSSRGSGTDIASIRVWYVRVLQPQGHRRRPRLTVTPPTRSRDSPRLRLDVCHHHRRDFRCPPSYSTAAAKAGVIEKTIMDSIAMQAIISDLEHATHTAVPAHSTAQKNAYWDSAAAKYFGTSAARSYAIYGSANKRGANYGQLMGSAYSATNKAIIDAFNGAVSEANMNIIVKNLKVIYAQAALRYAFTSSTRTSPTAPTGPSNQRRGVSPSTTTSPPTSRLRTRRATTRWSATTSQPQPSMHSTLATTSALLQGQGRAQGLRHGCLELGRYLRE